MLYASSWAFFLLLAVVPLMFLMLMAFDVFGADASFLIADMPEELKNALGTILQIASEASKGVSLIFAATTFYSASTLFSYMLKDGELIYLEKRRKNGLVRKIISFVILFAVFFIFAAVALFLLLSRRITALLPSSKFNKLLTKILFNFIMISVVYGIIVTVNSFICPLRRQIGKVLIGSFISLAIIVLGSIAFLVYVHYFASYTDLYGSLASVIVFMLWLYIITLALVFGNIITKLLINRSKK